MDDLQKQRIKKLRLQGQSYSKIAGLLGVSANTLKSYCQRNGLGNVGEERVGECCRNCGAELAQVPGRKPRRFCCAECRVFWWRANPKQTGDATYTFTCLRCGDEFTSYGNPDRKYCNHACYVAARFQVAA